MFVTVPIEVDITYVNKAWFTIKKPVRTNHYVIGFFQRGIFDKPPQCIINVLPSNAPEEIEKACASHLEEGCFLYSEEGVLPHCLKEIYDVHEFKIKEVNSEIHVNNLKNVWKDLKRQLKTVHISVGKKHLQLYCNEVSWRINNKHLTPTERFNLILQNCEIKGVKTTYENLIK